MIGLRLPSLSFLSAGLLGASLAFCFAPAKAAEGYDPWPGLVQDVFNNKPMQDGANVLSIEMPARAEDASVVPVTLRSKLSPADERRIKTITLVIDQNPAPMAAKFTLGADANVTAISTRVRVNNYTDVHAVAELTDGQLYVIKTFVKASGGCSARTAIASPSGVARSTPIERLLRFTLSKYEVLPGLVGTPLSRVSSPRSGCSTLMTRAPRSASVMVASGPARTREKSATRTPSRGSEAGEGAVVAGGTADSSLWRTTRRRVPPKHRARVPSNDSGAGH